MFAVLYSRQDTKNAKDLIDSLALLAPWRDPVCITRLQMVLLIKLDTPSIALNRFTAPKPEVVIVMAVG